KKTIRLSSNSLKIIIKILASVLFDKEPKKSSKYWHLIFILQIKGISYFTLETKGLELLVISIVLDTN
ncbi:hypothetical protein ACLUWP_06825, partial [Ligilactobacillus salivarius]|uniref:hypothetical protein n=1 Tax=Ligilactobacillus salivarius TaxID=1624 RepID=UPI0039923137